QIAAQAGACYGASVAAEAARDLLRNREDPAPYLRQTVLPRPDPYCPTCTAPDDQHAGAASSRLTGADPGPAAPAAVPPALSGPRVGSAGATTSDAGRPACSQRPAGGPPPDRAGCLPGPARARDCPAPRRQGTRQGKRSPPGAGAAGRLPAAPGWRG